MKRDGAPALGLGRFFEATHHRGLAVPNPHQVSVAVSIRLMQARLSAGFATSDATAIRLALPSERYRQHEQGLGAPKPAELRRYAEVFGISHGWLSTGVGVGPKKAG